MKKVITSAVLVSLLSAGLVLNNRGLEVRNVLDAYTNEAQGRLVTRRANEEATNNLSNVKAQISSVLENGKRHIRFVAALDSYLYDEVNFTITASDGTTTKTLVDNEAVNRAYTYIEAGEEVLSASEAFGEGYNYFVAYTINNVPESAWGYTFSASVSAKAEGYSETVTKSADRVINDMVRDEMTHEVPIMTYDTSINIHKGSLENVFDGDNSTFVWFEGTPSYIDFTFSKETFIDSLELLFLDDYGQSNLSSPPYISYYDATSDSFVELGEIEHNTWRLDLNSSLDSITTSKIRLSGPHRAWVGIAEFRYNFEDNVTLNGVGNYYHGSSSSLFDNNPNTTLWTNSTVAVNGYIDIELDEVTKLESLEISTVTHISGLPRVQYLAENGEFITLDERADNGSTLDLRNEEIYTNRIRLTTLQDEPHTQWVNYKDIVINGVTDDTPLLRLEGSSTAVWEGSALDVFDGDDSTYMWTAFSPRANDAYVITYPETFTLRNLYVNYRNGSAGEICSYDKIAYRTHNSEEWIDLDVQLEAEQSSLFLDLSNNVIENVKEIKLYTTKDIPVWGGLATFDVNYGAVCSSRLGEWDGANVEFNEGRFVSKVFDRNDSTYFWFNTHIEDEDYLTVDLGQTRRLVSLDILMKDGNNGSAFFGYIEYSLDGVNWSNKIGCAANEFTYNFDKITSVRYVRFSGGFGIWPSMASITLHSAF